MNTASPPAIVIVDAYASARCLAPLFRARGYDCVHVQSTPDIPRNYVRGFRAEDFSANLVHHGDVSETLRSLRAHRPLAIVPGVERAVLLADTLSEQLDLPSNGTALSSARRDKFRMIETVRAAGVPAVEQIHTADLDEVLRWHEKTGGGRVVLKPVSSTGSDGIFFCSDAEAVEAAFRSLHGTTSVLGQENKAVLAQEYLVGDEYIVNTVSRDGTHRVSDIWKMHTLSANGVAELAAGAELLPRRGPEQDALVEHTFQVLDALGIAHGPAHTELKLTPKGPRLVETGARVCGADVHVPVTAALGTSQLDLTVDAWTGPETFLAAAGEDYRIGRHARIVNMVAPRGGMLRSYPRLTELRELDSFHDVLFRTHPGDAVHPSVDDWTFPLRVYLLHEIASTVARDALTTRYLDGDGFYELD
ncbi:ATP-grasp domain-containing protein [Streptomyces sp. NPDC102402]|uniref:ATP-grasp domain-containing protein n=1 Tax=Streptomyces sp. NPDC102402 TaxID=3366169 RepID=UPI00381191DE